MSKQRHVRPFRMAGIRRDGERLAISPAGKRGLVALLKSMEPLDETFPSIDDTVPNPENVP